MNLSRAQGGGCTSRGEISLVRTCPFPWRVPRRTVWSWEGCAMLSGDLGCLIQLCSSFQNQKEPKREGTMLTLHKGILTHQLCLFWSCPRLLDHPLIYSFKWEVWVVPGKHKEQRLRVGLLGSDKPGLEYYLYSLWPWTFIYQLQDCFLFCETRTLNI